MTTILSNAPNLAAEDYCVLGLATCFVKEEGEVLAVKVIEPIPSAALEALIKGTPTSYEMATAKSLGEIFTGDTQKKQPNFL